MQNRIACIASALQSRDTPLGEPASSEAIRDLGLTFETQIGSDFHSVYSEFDGFGNYDHHSQLVIWSIDEIRKFRQKNGDIGDKEGWWCIGDFLIDSDYIAVQIEAESSEVMLLYEEKILGTSLASFLESLSEGSFDFLP